MEKIGNAKPGVMVAMVLGTALSTLGSGSAQAESHETTVRAAADISQYCTACWRNARLHPDQWQDCTHDVFLRLLERLSPATWSRILQTEGDERQELVRAVDAVKKRVQRSRKCSTLSPESVADKRALDEQCLADDRAAVEEASGEVLSTRQQRILRLTMQGWSIRDIAETMDLPPERVSDEKYKAVRRLQEHFGNGQAS